MSPGAARRRAIDRDDARPARGANRVGSKAFAIADVPDVDLFVLTDIGGLEQIIIDGARTFVVKLAMRGRYAVQLRLQHRSLHGFTCANRIKEKGIVVAICHMSMVMLQSNMLNG